MIGNSVENMPRLIHALTDSQASLSPFKADQMRFSLRNLSTFERSGHQSRVSFFNSGLTYRAPKQIVRGPSLFNIHMYIKLSERYKLRDVRTENARKNQYWRISTRERL